MTDLLIDPDTGDLAFENGDFSSVTGTDEYRQMIEQKLRLIQGGWFFNRTDGVPYLTRVFGKRKPDTISLNAVFVQAILSIDGILKLNEPIEYILDKANRKLSLVIKVKTESGNLSLTVEV